MFASTGNDEFKRRCDTIVGDLAECQTAAKTGLINAFPDNTAHTGIAGPVRVPMS